jgi:prepilin signal peptidase PulO-like enzyme (type II secretory pathway)
MDILAYIFAFCFGAAVGSFLNVVSLRYHTGRTIRGRSGCASCGAQLRWFELLPVLSFIALRGKCRSCLSAISWQYPIVEAITGALFVGLYYLYALQWGLFLLYAIEWSLLVIIVAYDMKHKIIPDPFVYAFIALSFLSLFITPDWTLHMPSGSWWPLLSGPLLAAPFAFLWLVSGGRWMGFGDAKLALGIGWVLGVTRGTTALLLSFWIGAVVSIALLLYERLSPSGRAVSRAHGRLTMKSEVPFAPFLILGMALVFFFGIDFVAFLV